MEFDIYGRIREDIFNNQPFIPFRQLGQYEDVETGLYYNRFRYYDSNTGIYISQDPIGLAGNNPNFYAYTHDSNTWIDPFVLDIFSIIDWTAPDPSKGGIGYTYKIFQKDVNWDLIDSKHRTNLDRALGGLAPIGADGKSINLHHSKQQAHGPLFELSATSHQQYGHTNALHPYRVTPNSDGTKFNPYDPVDRKAFDVDRKQYWKDRANAEIETRKLKIGCK
ncbi:HNH/ENDO VII family nuclease [Gilliamella sp. G0441]|uniref:HNH/ENDO VII family nuclease n=1 Tax=Gilliamella sp. G0441 TaxID=3384760 RepID=UPI003D34F39D